jgi:hypothetical protein
VIAPVDQNDVGIGSSQSASRGDPGETAAHDHDALSPPTRHGDDLLAFTTLGPCIVRPRSLHVL